LGAILVATLSVAMLPMSGRALAQDHAIVTPDQLTWKPLIPGVEVAVVSGDPDKKGGLYVIRLATCSPQQQRRWDSEAEGLGGLEVDGRRAWRPALRSRRLRYASRPRGQVRGYLIASWLCSGRLLGSQRCKQRALLRTPRPRCRHCARRSEAVSPEP